MLNPSHTLLAVMMLAPAAVVGGAYAQTTPQTSDETIKTEIYFGSDLGDGKAVSQEAWDDFVADVVTPRFPAGITVLEALGRGRATVGPLTSTRILVVIHPGGADTQTVIGEIRSEYRKRFATAGQFHVDHPVRLRN